MSIKKGRKLAELDITKKVTLFDALQMMLDTEVGCSRERAIFKLYQDDEITLDAARHVIGQTVDTWKKEK